MLTQKRATGRNSAPPEPDHAARDLTTVPEALVERRLAPGLLVIALPFHLIHMNQAAWEMLQELTGGECVQAHGKTPRLARGLLPRVVYELCVEIARHLRERPHAKDWERFEVKRLLGTHEHPFLLRGFGIPDPLAPDGARVIILLEAVGRKREAVSNGRIERFNLTEREKAVVECLSEGWTNKEIANALKLALPTVKEHIRHIMEKTKTTTRTGILVELFWK